MDTAEYKELTGKLEEMAETILVRGHVLDFNHFLARLRSEKGFEYNETLLRDALNNLFKKGFIEIRFPVILDDEEPEKQQFSICIGRAYYL